MQPQTILQSGNLVSRGSSRATAALERQLEAAAAKRLGIETDFLVRTAGEWDTIVAGNPFPREAERDPSHLVVLCAKTAIQAAAAKALQAASIGPEMVRVGGRHAYLTHPDGLGRSKLTNALIEKKLGTCVTARNWNTVLKIVTATNPEP